MSCDIAIIGAGPAGLCFARALAGSGLQVTLVDPQSRQELAEPAFDGREIAINHFSRRLLEDLGIWQRLEPTDISPLRDAVVYNEDAPEPLRISHRDGGGRDALGYLVANHLIRRHAFAAVMETPGITLIDNCRVEDVSTTAQDSRLQLADGRALQARLVVAADGRYSGTRRALGIGAAMRDFGRSMLVCRVALERDHEHTAWEWFGRDQTLALLPLNNQQASVVITLPDHEIRRLAGIEKEAFNAEVSRRFDYRLGMMRQVSPPITYSLTGVYPDRFVARRFAVIGDAAVGMHPVTAHGFNLGLRGVADLSRRVKRAAAREADIGAPGLLTAYDRCHRRHTLPLYLATRAIVGLYTDDRPPARLLRHLGLRLASNLPPLRWAIAASLADEGR